jgi:N-methylhydantoinase A
LRLRQKLAEQAMQPIATALNSDTTHAAESVIAVATSNMLANALPFIARLGLEPRALTLMIYGGAGGIHGPLLAEEIGIGRVIVPRLSSVFCAFGCLVSDLLYDLVRTVHGMALTPNLVRESCAALTEQGRDWLAAQPGDANLRFEYSAAVRYAGQSFDVTTPIPLRAAGSGDVAAIAESFHSQHQRLYGHADPGAPIEVLSLRVRVRGELPRPAAIPMATHATNPPPHHTRNVRFDSAWHPTPVLHWTDLPTDWHRAGPAIIEQETATVLIPPGFSARLSPFGDLILERR